MRHYETLAAPPGREQMMYLNGVEAFWFPEDTEILIGMCRGKTKLLNAFAFGFCEASIMADDPQGRIIMDYRDAVNYYATV